MALGQQLRTAREKMGLTASEVAAGTNMKVQIVEDLEHEDFTRLAAPIYGRGFIKLYAEYVDLAAQPLIDEYMSLLEGDHKANKAGRPSLRTAKKKATRRAMVPQEAVDSHYAPDESAVVIDDDKEPDLFTAARRKLLRRRDPASTTLKVPTPAGPSRTERVAAIRERIVSLCTPAMANLQERLGGMKRLTPVKLVAAIIGLLLFLFVLVLVVQYATARPGGSDAQIHIVVPEPYFE